MTLGKLYLGEIRFAPNAKNAAEPFLRIQPTDPYKR